MPNSGTMILASITVVLTYAGIAIGQIPGLRMNRATIAVVGAATMLGIGAITQKQAAEAIDFSTLVLLFAMMVINSNLRLAGFFTLVGERVLQLARSPRTLLGLVIVASGVLSALFLNDTICILFTPLVAELTVRLRRNAVPYLIGLAVAANVGSTATITGNPQNLIIGQGSGIPYLTFLLHLGPVALVGLLVCWLVIISVYRDEFRGTLGKATLPEPYVFQPLLNRSLAVLVVLLGAFLVGLPVASSALIAAAFLMVSRIRPEKILDIDWVLLVFFTGLFIVTHAIETTGMSKQVFEALSPILQNGVGPLSIATAGLSNVVSNVPAVLLLRPEIPHLANPQQAWLAVAMSSTLAGNLTLLGSVANLIVAEIAAKRGIRITFLGYLRVGLPITVITIVIGMVWLTVV